MKEKYKHILKSTLILLSSVIYFFLAYIGFTKQNIDLKSLSTHIGNIENRGVDFRVGSKGRRSMVFFIDIQGLNQRLGIYRMDRDYKDLYQTIRLGDNVKVYFEEHKIKENVNIDLVQIEINGLVIFSKNEYEKKESALIWIGIFFGTLTVLISWLYYKRNLGALTN